MMIFDWHIHSKYSSDSLMSPEKIIRVAQQRGFNCIAITDHNSIKGAVEAKQYENKKMKILIGEEIITNLGELIGVNIKKEIQEKEFFKALDEIKEQGGISILPHPYKGHKDVEKIAKHVDIIEAYNSRLTKKLNNKARLLAGKFNKPFLAGSDAHFYCDIGNSRNLLNNCFSIVFSSAFYWTISISQIIKAIKKKRLKSVIPNVIQLLSNGYGKIYHSEKIQTSLKDYQLLLQVLKVNN